MATGFPVKANYATGDVLTAANMNDLSGTVNYLQYMPPRNAILNSNFSVWQRGTSISVAASTSTPAYLADRWCTVTAANQAITVSRQATGDTTNLPNIQYALRYQRNSGQTGTGTLNLITNLESVNSIPFSGKTVTVSFYARAGANYSTAASALPVYLYSGTGTDQNAFVVYTGIATVASTTATLTTNWQRFTFTGTVAATATELALAFAFTPTGTAGANDYFEVTGVQLELGSVANIYMPNQPTYEAELAACQRYYYNSLGQNQLVGVAPNTTTVVLTARPPVTMRTTPTATLPASGSIDSYQDGAKTSATAPTTVYLSDSLAVFASGGYTGLTVGSTATWRLTTAFQLSAEL